MKQLLVISLFISYGLVFSQNFSLSDSVFELNDKYISHNILFEFSQFELHERSIKNA